jgi:hypothetical protein
MRNSPEKLGITAENAVPGSPEAIFLEAFTKADTAVTYSFVEFGGEPAYCGFAWVKIKPARGAFVKFCKKHGIGDNGSHGGWEIWSPFSYNGQSMDLKEAGAKAFADVLKSHGITAWMQSRAD